MAVSEDNRQAPVLWFSADGGEWSRVAELPVERIAIGAPLVGIGAMGMVAVKVGDPEAEAFGAESELSVWTSTDGRTWTETDPGGFSDAGYLHELDSTTVGWVVAGEYVVDAHTVVPAIYWSATGEDWRRVYTGQDRGAARSVVAGDDGLLVVGAEGGSPAAWHSIDGVDWSQVRLPASTHGGIATGGAWVGDRWLVVGTGSEVEPMSIWTSVDGFEWENLGQLVKTSEQVSVGENRFGQAVTVDNQLVVGATRLRYAHENFCFETEQCFVATESILATSDGRTWSETPAPPSDRIFSLPPGVTVSADGRLITVTIFEGALTVWSTHQGQHTTSLREDPPVPELTVERAEWGQTLQPDTPYAWVLNTHCGIGQLGEFNEQVWKLEDEDQPPPPGTGGYDNIYGVIVLTKSESGDTITFTSGEELIGQYVPRPTSETRLCM